MEKLLQLGMLFLCTMCLATVGYAGNAADQSKECPEGQVFDEELGTCVSAPVEEGTGTETEKPSAPSEEMK